MRSFLLSVLSCPVLCVSVSPWFAILFILSCSPCLRGLQLSGSWYNRRIILHRQKQENKMINNTTLAILYALLTGIFWALGSFVARFWMRGVSIHPTLVFAIRETVAFVGVWILALPIALQQGPQLLAAKEGRQAILALALLTGLVSSLGGHLLFYHALSMKEIELSTVMVLAFTSPVWGTLLALGFGIEPFSWVKVLGVGVTFVGVAIVLWG